MSVPPRGARVRRSGRRPGWQLLTVLLVLAILASSTMVFTSRVELLRLAVILSLWAAVAAAFVSVIYRRQSEQDQSRARDMKYIYDLQLDREIAARREYELSVETHLRRQLARERDETAGEMAALRAELASLRTHLEALVGADLGGQPALESDRVAFTPQIGRVESSRITVTEEVVITEETSIRVDVDAMDGAAVAASDEPPIIDVPEEPLAPPVAAAPPQAAPQAPPPQAPPPAAPPQPPPPVQPEYRGSHRRLEDSPPAPVFTPAPPAPPPPAPAPPPQQPAPPWRPPETTPRRGRHWVPDDGKAEPASAERPDHSADEPLVEESTGQHTGGHSVADLMARLRVDAPVSGGGRRRRED